MSAKTTSDQESDALTPLRSLLEGKTISAQRDDGAVADEDEYSEASDDNEDQDEGSIILK